MFCHLLATMALLMFYKHWVMNTLVFYSGGSACTRRYRPPLLPIPSLPRITNGSAPTNYSAPTNDSAPSPTVRRNTLESLSTRLWYNDCHLFLLTTIPSLLKLEFRIMLVKDLISHLSMTPIWRCSYPCFWPAVLRATDLGWKTYCCLDSSVGGDSFFLVFNSTFSFRNEITRFFLPVALA